MLHLRGQNRFETLAQATRRIQIPLAALGEDRREEGEALDVIPVGVRDHQMTVHGMLALGHQGLPEAMGAGATVQDDQGSVVGPRLDTGGIAAVAQRRRPWGRQ